MKKSTIILSDYVIDKENKIVSTPAYNSTENIFEVYQGSDKLIETLVKLIKK